MLRLLLASLCRHLAIVAVLADLADRFRVHGEASFWTFAQSSFQLSMNNDICISTDWTGEVRVERDIERIVVIIRNVIHATADILGLQH